MTQARNFLLAVLTVFLTVFTFTSCQKDQAAAPAEAQQVTDETNYYTPSLGDFVTDRSGYWTEIPAGSVDVLNAAIAEADEGGVIYLKAGMHTETGRVTVNKRVKIIGEDGAVLKIASEDTNSTLNPALYVLNAPGTAIQNVEILPHGDIAYTAIAFENSPLSAVLKCKISGFPMSILVEKSDQVAIIGNVIKSGYSDPAVEPLGILINRGKSVYIADNDISEFVTGLWACDRWGTIERNNFHHNLYSGVLLCKYPSIAESTIPSSTEFISAEVTCTAWKIRNNKFIDNGEIGLSIRDSANLNFVETNNEYSGNGSYDINIPPDEDFLPIIFIPAAYKNTINASQGVKIKDCGIDNVINGGTLVDTTVDPC